LKTSYAPTLAETDTGHAANEPCFAPFRAPVTAVNAPKAFVDGSKALHDGENDNYFLGGYAGI
jgi:hypothetical protein